MKKPFLFLFFVFLVAVPGCMRQRIVIDSDVRAYKHAALTHRDATWHRNQDNVMVLFKKLNSDDCWHEFSVNPLRVGYQPLKITVSNFSQASVYLNPTMLGLPLVHPKKVAKACHWRNWELSSGATVIAAVFFWPALIGIGGTSYGMRQRNRAITKNIMSNQTLYYQDVVKVRPLETVTNIIFVESDAMNNDFVCTVYSKEKKEFIDFQVQF